MSQDIAIIGLSVDTAGIKEGTKELDKLDESTKKVEKSASSLKDTFAGISAAFKEGLSGGMAEAQREIEKTQAMLNDPKMRLETASNARSALGMRGDLEIKAEIDATRQAYVDLKSTGLATTSELSRAKSEMITKIRELNAEMGKWDMSWDNVGKKIGEAGSRMQGLGTKLAIAGAPAILVGKQVIDAEHDLYALANTAGIAQEAAAKAVKDWNAAILLIAKDTNQQKAELIGAMGTLVSKGLSPEDALKFLKPLGDAATATGAAVDDVAKSLFATYENLKVPIADAAKSLDMMALAGNKGAFELKDMSQYFPILTASAHMLGMEGSSAVAQLAAAAQISRRSAADASSAANNLADFIQKLSSPTVAKAMADLGVNMTVELKKGLESGDLIQYMGEMLQRVTGGSAEVLSSVIQDKQARMFASQIMTDLEDYKKIRDAALGATGVVAAQKDVILGSMSEQFKGIGITFSAAIETSTVLQTVMEKIKIASEWFVAHPDIFGTLATAVAGLAVAGTGMVVLGTAFSAIGTAMGVIGSAWGIASVAFTGLLTFVTGATGAAVVAALPVIATGLAAIAGVVAAWKVGFAFGTWISEQINVLVQSITGDEAATLGTKLYDLIEGPNGVVATLRKVPDTLAGYAEKMKQAGVDWLQKFREGITSQLSGSFGIGAKLDEAYEYIKGTAKRWYQVGVDIIDGLWTGMKATIRKPIEAIKQLATDLPQWARDLLGIHSPSTVFVGIGQEVSNGMAQGIEEGAPKVASASEKMAEKAMKAAARAAAKEAKETARLITQATKNSVEEASKQFEQEAKQWDAWQKNYDSVKAKVTALADAMEPARVATEKFQGQMDALTEAVFLDIISLERYLELTEMIATGKAKVAETSTATLTQSVSIFGQAWTEAANGIADKLSEALLTGFQNGKTFAQAFTNSVSSMLKTLVLSPATKALGTGSSNAILGFMGLDESGGLTGSGGPAGMLSSLSSAFAPGAISTEIGMMAGGVAEMMGATSAAAGSIGMAVATAIPYIGAIVAIAAALGLFDSKPSNKAAGGAVNTATGASGSLWQQSGDKTPSAETLAARDALLSGIGVFSTMVRDMGGTGLPGTVGIDIGERDGLQARLDSAPMKSYGSDIQAGLEQIFKDMLQGVEGMNASVKTMLLNFTGGGEAMLKFGAYLSAVQGYIDDDVLGTVLEKMDAAGESAYAMWEKSKLSVEEAASAFDGTLSTAEALAEATQSRYALELGLIQQIQSLLASTAAMFGNSIQTIQLDMMDSAQKYEFYRRKVDEQYLVLMTAVDPNEIAKASEALNSYAMSAWGLLDPAQRAQYGSEFVAYLQEAQEQTAATLGNAQSLILDEHAATAATLEEVLSKVADKMVEAANAQLEAAKTQLEAAKEPVKVEVSDAGGYVGEASAPGEVGY